MRKRLRRQVLKDRSPTGPNGSGKLLSCNPKITLMPNDVKRAESKM